MKNVSALYSYPIKSTGTQSHNSINLDVLGLEGDRKWAIIDENNKCITSRDYPQLLHLNCSDSSDFLEIKYKEEKIAKLEKAKYRIGTQIEFQIHSYTAFGYVIDHPINEWLSNFTDLKCKLVLLNKEEQRPVLSKHGGDKGETVGFSDQAPILIISEASLNEINSRLEEKIGMNRFRPNIVVSNCTPYEEDTWKEISIGDTRLRIIQQSERCVLITIDPTTLVKHKRAEPLTTLSRYRKGPRGGIIFGVHAVPIANGTINLHDEVKIIR